MANRKRNRGTKRLTPQQKVHRKHVKYIAHCEKGLSYEARNYWLRILGFDDYAKYLASNLWRLIREKTFLVHGRICYLCKCQAEVIHHSRYHKEDLDGSCFERLHPLCHICHHHVEFDCGSKVLVRHAIKRLQEFKQLEVLPWHADPSFGSGKARKYKTMKPRCCGCHQKASKTWHFNGMTRYLCEDHWYKVMQQKSQFVQIEVVKRMQADKMEPPVVFKGVSQ